MAIDLPQSLPSALAVLTSMITPALLISATGTFILSTSNRLGRVVDRVRSVSEKMDILMHPADPPIDLLDERKKNLIEQLGQLSERAGILQRSLTVFYLASGAFVATSVAIGIAAALQTAHVWVPVMLGFIGSGFLFYGSVMLIFEARLAVANLERETIFLRRLVDHHQGR